MSSPGRFLQRWSRLKRNEAPGDAPPRADVTPAPGAGSPPPATAAPAVVLPPVESLDLSSDFTAFLKEEVSESLRRAALKKLFGDPVFNAMDGLDIYIDDYSIPDPIAPDVMQRLKQFETFLVDRVGQAERDEPADQPHARGRADELSAGAIAVSAPGPGAPGEQISPRAASDRLPVGGQDVLAAVETIDKCRAWGG